jgi:hypothetical protein
MTEREQLIQMLVKAGVEFTTHPNDGNSVLVEKTLDFRFDASDRLQCVEGFEGVL